MRAGLVYPVLNRGNGRMRLFHKPTDYVAFEFVLAQGLHRYAMNLLCYCLMPHHLSTKNRMAATSKLPITVAGRL